MTPRRFLLIAGFALSLGACSSQRRLPLYERPVTRSEFQTVRTTAYTDTESDHRQYGNRTSLGGELHAAPTMRVPQAIPVSDSARTERSRSVAYVSRGELSLTSFGEPVYGSAAADWSRWPAGTIFRLLATGQLYRVEDYGWALAGRNTIDLYMATRRDMNNWGVRSESIQVVQWGDAEESLRRLTPHLQYRHIRRMVLELEGHNRAAASLK